MFYVFKTPSIRYGIKKGDTEEWESFIYMRLLRFIWEIWVEMEQGLI